MIPGPHQLTHFRWRGGSLRWFGLIALILLVRSSVAVAAPVISGLTNGQVTASVPSFTITSDAATFHVTLSGPEGDLIDDDETPLTLGAPFVTPAFPEAGEGPYTLTVTQTTGVAPLTASLGFSVDKTGPATPSIVLGPSGIIGPFRPMTFTWALQPTATSSHWQLLRGSTLLSEGDVPAPASSVVVTPQLPPGDLILNFRVSLRDSLLNPSLFGTWPPFVVDQTPPGAPTDVTGPTGTIRTLTPTFSWQGTEIGGTFEWNVTDADGKSILSAGVVRTTAGTSITTPSLQLAPNVLHKLTFRVRQIDPYGNRGPESGRPFTITTKPLPGAKPRTRYASYMSPKVGRAGVSLQPLLAWRRMNAGTSIFNVQIYRGNVKVLSRFPTRNRFLVPRGKLKPGVLYTWTVWSYLGKKKTYAPLPMTSYFTTRP